MRRSCWSAGWWWRSTACWSVGCSTGPGPRPWRPRRPRLHRSPHSVVVAPIDGKGGHDHHCGQREGNEHQRVALLGTIVGGLAACAHDPLLLFWGHGVTDSWLSRSPADGCRRVDRCSDDRHHRFTVDCLQSQGGAKGREPGPGPLDVDEDSVATLDRRAAAVGQGGG